MKRRRPPWYVTKFVKAATDDQVDGYGHAYTVLAVCRCGHVAAVQANGPDTCAASAALSRRLRCVKCRERAPKIEVYRRPR
jgi:hypothetical protein